jgi:glycosyltransferase involved in cell wall biosynthesis
MNPRISVLMPVYNGMPYIRDAVESIQGQTIHDWELIIINDCSTDETENYLSSLQDSRVRVIKNENNVGPGISIKRGFENCKGPYVARLDADDIALPERLEKQIAFLDLHPDYGLVGAGCLRINEYGEELDTVIPTASSAELRWKLFFVNPFISSSVVFRATTIQAHQIEFPNYVGTEDFALWSKISAYDEVGNLKTPLVKYRVRDAGLSKTNALQMSEDELQISFLAIQSCFPKLKINTALVESIRKWRKHFLLASSADMKLARLYLQMLRIYVNDNKQTYDLRIFSEKERNRFWKQIYYQKSMLALFTLTPYIVAL